MKILNLYAGLGGNRFLWDNVEVTAIEHDPVIAALYSKRFPKDLVLEEEVFQTLRAKEFSLDFDLIWASPPCQSHSQMMKFPQSKTLRIPFPKLTEIYGLLIWLERYYTGAFVIENVQPYYKLLIPPTIRLGRHYFWSNFPIPKKQFGNPGKGHGKLRGIIRTNTHELIKQNQLEDIEKELLGIPRRDRLMRNCVDPRIGQHILSALRQNPSLEQWVNP